MKKQIVLEFNIDQDLNWYDALYSGFEASHAARLAIDTLLGRIGNGRGSAAGEVTIRWYGYGRPAKSVNGGTVQWYGKYLKHDSDADDNEQ